MPYIENALVRALDINKQLDVADKNITGFGIDFLDRALLGLIPSDLCLIGAKSGKGKSALGIAIASYNASVYKKNVVFLALEAEKLEVEMRLRYEIEAGLFFADQNRNKSIVVNYRSWRMGKLKAAFVKYRDQAVHEFTQRFATLNTVYRDKDFGLKELEYMLDEAKDFGELFIFDHLHYFDLETGENENSQVSRLIKKIRELNLFYSKPFIVIAHIRKHVEGLIPDQEDFMGSSDIYKNATAIAMMTPKPDGYDATAQTQDTIFSVPKLRTGALGNLVGIQKYSLRHQMYVPGFRLARALKRGEKLEEISKVDWPDWAKEPETTTEFANYNL